MMSKKTGQAYLLVILKLVLDILKLQIKNEKKGLRSFKGKIDILSSLKGAI